MVLAPRPRHAVLLALLALVAVSPLAAADLTEGWPVCVADHSVPGGDCNGSKCIIITTYPPSVAEGPCPK